jgi:hypothetical protein
MLQLWHPRHSRVDGASGHIVTAWPHAPRKTEEACQLLQAKQDEPVWAPPLEYTTRHL